MKISKPISLEEIALPKFLIRSYNSFNLAVKVSIYFSEFEIAVLVVIMRSSKLPTDLLWSNSSCDYYFYNSLNNY